MGLLAAGLEKQLITVPGVFFDINPGKRRSQEHSRFRNYARFSFGPDTATLERASERLFELVREAQ